jgi:hypothetical protein
MDEKTVKSGEAKTRAAAKTSVIWTIDKASSRKVNLGPPSDDVP